MALLTAHQIDEIVFRAKSTAFADTRKNVAPWCLMWFCSAWGLVLLLAFFGNGGDLDNPKLFRVLALALVSILLAVLNRSYWQHYKTLYVLRQQLEQLDLQQASSSDSS
jgi:hypothetical protein